MIRHARFEQGKVYRKKSFVVAACVVLILNVFLLWYLNTRVEQEVPLEAYKSVCSDLRNMTEQEKLDFISTHKDMLDGVYYVRTAQVLMAANDDLILSDPETYNRYLPVYESGNYLRYTNDLESEKALFDDLYAEIKSVLGYGEYLRSVQETEGSLSGISIFGGTQQDTFSYRNVKKSAADYGKLTAEHIRYLPSKGITLAMESKVTDLFALLTVLLFVGISVTEEKEKGLFYITRATRYGMAHNMAARLVALLLHSVGIAALLWGTNLLFSGVCVGGFDLTARLQSVSVYLQGALNIRIWQYLLLSVLSKGFVLFGFGAFLVLLAILSYRNFVPPLCGIGLFGLGWLLYQLIPAQSPLAMLKYLNLYGLLRTEELYGAYLNLNVLGFPVSRLALSTILAALFAGVCATTSVLVFVRRDRLKLKKTQLSSLFPSRPHGSLFRHECYKILVMNRGAAVLMLFAALILFGNLSKNYAPSQQEQYYQSFMLELQGELTSEKAQIIADEEARYEQAFAKLEEIHDMVADGAISEEAGDALKAKWYGEVAFYPAFQRILTQYDHITENGGSFVYDTGYLYLLGTMDDSFQSNFLLLTLCFVLAFGNVIAMEYQKNAWGLLAATAGGRRLIVRQKVLVCFVCAAVMTALPWIVRTIHIGNTYPFSELTAGIQNIPHFCSLVINLPIFMVIALSILFQLVSGIMLCGIILAVSQWRKSYLQAVFFSILLLVVPILLSMMGFDAAKYFSLYPLYGWTGLV